MEKSIKVFFSAPSIKTAEQKKLYEEIRKAILSVGVITYDWIKDYSDFRPKSWAEKAKAGIRGADLLVAEISKPSTGVGLQIAYASSHKVPIIALVNEEARSQSSVSENMSSQTITEVVYNPKNLKEKLSEAIKNRTIANFVKFNFISTHDINEYLEEESSRMGMTRSEYLRRLIRNSMRSPKVKKKG